MASDFSAREKLEARSKSSISDGRRSLSAKTSSEDETVGFRRITKNPRMTVIGCYACMRFATTVRYHHCKQAMAISAETLMKYAEDEEDKRLCFKCVGEKFLSEEIRSRGRTKKCNYCGKTRRTYSIGDLGSRVEKAFDQHFFRTSDQPDDWEYTLLRDKESSYNWERHGELVVYAIMNAAEIPVHAARDIQAVLEEKYSDFDRAAIGEETEFAEDSYYEETSVNDAAWRERWHAFEEALKTEARFFSRSAAALLESVFAGLEGLQTKQGRAVVIEAGPGTTFKSLSRARVFQSDEKLEAALCRQIAT